MRRQESCRICILKSTKKSEKIHHFLFVVYRGLSFTPVWAEDKYFRKVHLQRRFCFSKAFYILTQLLCGIKTVFVQPGVGWLGRPQSLAEELHLLQLNSLHTVNLELQPGVNWLGRSQSLTEELHLLQLNSLHTA
jgi:hypothetical protein